MTGRSGCALLLLSVSLTPVAPAQAIRTWVSGAGDDANPCSRTTPCKTFAKAFAVTAPGGEISVLDPGGYGPITITRSVTIDGTGSLASLLAGSNIVGITINLTEPQDTAKSVRIRGLSIIGAGLGSKGIHILSAGKISIEETVIDGFRGDAISVATPGNTQVMVMQSTLRNNGAAVSVSGQGNQVALSEVAVLFNTFGLAAAGGGTVHSFRNNVFFGNRSDGMSPSSLIFR